MGENTVPIERVIESLGAELPAPRSARLAERLEKQTWPLLFICAIVSWLSLAASAARPFWFDELFSFHMARLPDLATLLRALSKGADLQPPLFHLTTAAFQKLFGSSEVATRLPALAGYLLMTVCLYLFVRRRTNALYGAIAALFPTVTEAFRYSYEARPYSLMLGFCALALWCWQQAASACGLGRKIGLVGLWLSLSLALSFQYYSVLVFIPLAIGEAVRLFQRRQPDIPIALAGGLAAVVGICYLPLIRDAAAIHANHPWNAVSLRLIFDAYQFALSPAAVPMAFCFAAIGLLVWLPHVAESPARTGGLTLAETAACLGFTLVPVFGYLTGRFFTHLLTQRYMLALIIGFAILFASAVYSVTGGRAIAALVVAALLGGVFVARHIARPRMVNEYAALTLPPENRDLPLVVAGSLEFVPQLYYGNPDVKSRLIWVDLATHFHGVDAVDRNVRIAVPFFHYPMMEYDEFRRAHPRFFLLANPATDWMAKRLQADGAALELEPSPDDASLYLVTLKP